jgi:hypothetical protein
MVRKRGILLYLILIILFLNSLQGIGFIINLGVINTQEHPISPLLMPITLLTILFGILAIYGIFRWKKWGIYVAWGCLICSTLEVIVNMLPTFNLHGRGELADGLIFPLVFLLSLPYLILYLAVKNKLNLFD